MTQTTNLSDSDKLLFECLDALKAHFTANSEITVGRDGRERCTINSIKADHVMKDLMEKIVEHFA